MENKDIVMELVNEMRNTDIEVNDDATSDYQRAAKVANIKAMISAGIYDVSSKDVAEKLIKMLF
jgi:anti-sigma28 factor (negative regulator of flagellin synthesis)